MWQHVAVWPISGKNSEVERQREREQKSDVEESVLTGNNRASQPCGLNVGKGERLLQRHWKSHQLMNSETFEEGAVQETLLS